MVKVIIMILVIVTAASIYRALKFYRLYEEARVRAIENAWDLKELASYIHHEGWAERPWGTLPSYKRTREKAEKIYQKFYSEEEPSE